MPQEQGLGASSQSEDRAATPSEPSQSTVVSGVAGIPCADELPIIKALENRPFDLTFGDLWAAAGMIRDLCGALEQMVAEKRDYMLINKLGNPDEQHTVKAANAALAKARGQ